MVSRKTSSDPAPVLEKIKKLLYRLDREEDIAAVEAAARVRRSALWVSRNEVNLRRRADDLRKKREKSRQAELQADAAARAYERRG